MLFLLSPAKSLDYQTPLGALADLEHSSVVFASQTRSLIEVLRGYSPAQIAELMDLSDALAALNVARYQAWSPRYTARNSRQAVLAFNGDVYEGLDAWTLTPAQLQWAQAHLHILSGLYGVLRPLDRMQPYRLEMGTRLPTERGRNLYQFWGPQIAQWLNRQLAADRTPVVIHLASQEYFKAVDLRVLRARVVECIFEEQRGSQTKVISFMAKRARGLMARWAVVHQATTPAQLQAFDLEGYAYVPSASGPDRYVFRRRSAE